MSDNGNNVSSMFCNKTTENYIEVDCFSSIPQVDGNSSPVSDRPTLGYDLNQTPANIIFEENEPDLGPLFTPESRPQSPDQSWSSSFLPYSTNLTNISRTADESQDDPQPIQVIDRTKNNINQPLRLSHEDRQNPTFLPSDWSHNGWQENTNMHSDCSYEGVQDETYQHSGWNHDGRHDSTNLPPNWSQEGWQGNPNLPPDRSYDDWHDDTNLPPGWIPRRNNTTVHRDNRTILASKLPTVFVTNHRSFFPKFHNFLDLMKTLGLTLGLHSEIWENKEKKQHRNKIEEALEMEGVQYISNPRPNRRGGGAAITLIEGEFTLTKLDVICPSNLEVVWGLVKPKEPTKQFKGIIVCSFYSVPHSTKKTQLIEHITINYSQLKVGHKNCFFLCGGDKNDLNIKHILDI